MGRRILATVCLLALAIGCSRAPSKNKSGSNSTNSATNSANHGNNGATNMFGVPLQTPGSQKKLDVLLVVDNTGSMCQEQRLLRDNFDQFLDTLNAAGVDFQIGLTTTHMRADYPLEPIAKPGHLQSTPQPVPGFDRSCHTAVDSTGQPIQGDYAPIRASIEAAVNCMQTPDQDYLSVTSADIECALYGQPQGCSIARAGCGGGGGGGGNCSPEDLFPPTGSYREIPTVLRSVDYTDGSTLDVARLRADFACMSYVGTRGYGIEKGLAAAVEAVSPDLTGGVAGAAGADTSAPNHGLIRGDAQFGLIFVTDENDCSHDGTLAEDSSCGGDICEFANREGDIDSPLIEPAELQQQFISNLADSKGDPDFPVTDVFVASIHGNSKRFVGEPATEAECGSSDYEGIAPTCATSLGIAFSGDRYERFLRQFPAGQFYPEASTTDPDSPLTGWICTGDYRPALLEIGEVFTSSGSCVDAGLAECPPEGGCPDAPITEAPGNCVMGPVGLHSYCDSELQVRAVASVDGALEASGYCTPDTFDTAELPNGCVIDSSRYQVSVCDGSPGLSITWNDANEATNALAGAELYLYAVAVR